MILFCRIGNISTIFIKIIHYNVIEKYIVNKYYNNIFICFE